MSFGKIPEPQMNYDRFQVRGCGDPNCSQCNSHIPREVAMGMSFGGASSINRSSGIDSMASSLNSATMASMLRDEMMRSMISPSVMRWSDSPFNEMPKPSVPAAYTEARKAVKEYILEVNHDTAWDDVIGNDDARAALIEAIEEPKLHPELYKHYGMKPPKGVLLFGPPGCGKTMFAKAAAAAVGRVYGAKAEVMVINGPAIQSPYVGVTEQKIRAIFLFAREYAKQHKHPLTVFFDEAEVLFPDRTGRTRRVSPWEESQVAQFLAEMDGLNTLGAFVILATNRPEAIDEALLRDGRCDRKIKVDRPTKSAVEHILRKTLTGIPMGAQIDDLVMAGAESFFNPHYVIHEGHIISGLISEKGVSSIKNVAVNFCLEHIVSGAMVTSVASRAKSRAFARDRASGEMGGLQVPDVLAAVKQIFEENKTLEHSFAIKEFVDGLHIKEMLEPKGRVQ